MAGMSGIHTRKYEWMTAYVHIGDTYVQCIIDSLSLDVYAPMEYAFMCKYSYLRYIGTTRGFGAAVPGHVLSITF